MQTLTDKLAQALRAITGTPPRSNYDHLPDPFGVYAALAEYDRQCPQAAVEVATAEELISRYKSLAGEDAGLAGDAVHAGMATGATSALYEPNTGGGVWLSHTVHRSGDDLLYVCAGCDSVCVYHAPAADAEQCATAIYALCGEDKHLRVAEYFAEANDADELDAAAANNTTVHVLFGEAPEVGAQPETFQFGTTAERNAFVRGLEVGSGHQDYTICPDASTTKMADGEIRSVPAGVNPEGPVVIYQMRTADDCSKTVVYGTDDAGRVVEVDAGSWSPGEPELETIAVDIEVHQDPDDREDAELTGEQHRDLEDNGLLNDFLTSLAKRDPDAADEILREVGAEGLRL